MVLYVSDIAARDGAVEGRLHPRHPESPAAAGDPGPRRAGSTIDKERKTRRAGPQGRRLLHLPRLAAAARSGADHFATGYFPFAYEEFFPKLPLAKGDREMTMGELSARSAS